jgi:hypothetical protein
MRCPGCGADNPADAKRCASCGERLARRPRRQEAVEEADTPWGKRTDSRHRTALNAYRYGVFSLIPFVGLVLGPVAIVLALLAWRQARGDPSITRSGHVQVALLLGTVTLLANGIGLALMVIGLTSPSP